jgi:hypothetical protein
MTTLLQSLVRKTPTMTLALESLESRLKNYAKEVETNFGMILSLITRMTKKGMFKVIPLPLKFSYCQYSSQGASSLMSNMHRETLRIGSKLTRRTQRFRIKSTLRESKISRKPRNKETLCWMA